MCGKGPVLVAMMLAVNLGAQQVNLIELPTPAMCRRASGARSGLCGGGICEGRTAGVERRR